VTTKETVETAVTQPVSLRLDIDIIQHLRRVARYESFERDIDVTYSDLIREAILQTYPMPKDVNADTNKSDIA
jgi:hypothetical protein